MYKTFNMGIGFCVIVAKNKVEEIIKVMQKDRMASQIIGKIKSNGNGDTIVKSNNNFLKI